MNEAQQLKWDMRFLGLAQHIASWSRDPSTKCGSCIVDSDKRVLSLGFNGFAQGVDDNDTRYTDRDIKYELVVHSEANSLLFCPRQAGPQSPLTIYVHPFPPCSRCAAMICQSAIHRIVSWSDDYNNPRWKKSFDLAELQYKEAGVILDLMDSTTKVIQRIN